MKKNSMGMISFCLSLILTLSFLPIRVGATEQSTQPMRVAASAALLADLSCDQILFEQDAREKRYPASITKVMTALLVMEAIDRGDLDPNKMVSTSATALADISKDSSTQNIKAGESMSVENLLYCLLISSANETANILAETVSGSIPAFVDAMNARAAELGMTGTHFMNPHGLHHENHYSTAYDIFLMAREALSHPLFSKIVSTATYSVPATNLSGVRKMYNTNAMLSSWKYTGYLYSSAIGVKTGSTPEAGYCLVSAAKEDGRTLIAVVLNADNVTKEDGSIDRKQFSDSKRLLQWGFSSFVHRTLMEPSEHMKELPVTLSKGPKYVVVHPAEPIEATILTSIDLSKMTTTLSFNSETVEAPVREGQILGTISVSYGDTVYGTTNLVAVSNVERSTFSFLLDRTKTAINSLPGRLIILALAVLVILRWIRNASLRGRRSARKRRGSQRRNSESPRRRR